MVIISTVFICISVSHTQISHPRELLVTGGFLTETLDEINARSFHQDLTHLAWLPPCRSLSNPCDTCSFPTGTPSLGFLIPHNHLPPFPNQQPLTASSSAGSPGTSAGTCMLPQAELTSLRETQTFPSIHSSTTDPSRSLTCLILSSTYLAPPHARLRMQGNFVFTRLPGYSCLLLLSNKVYKVGEMAQKLRALIALP